MKEIAMPTSTHTPTANGTDTLADQMDQAADLAKAAADEGLRTMRKRAADLYQAGAEKAAAMKDCTVDFVRENPVKTVLLAAGIGALVGFLVTRRV
jgi:ElaB/YqjD/DUF883 family membrane-anchored ribosome-binding protein